MRISAGSGLSIREYGHEADFPVLSARDDRHRRPVRPAPCGAGEGTRARRGELHALWTALPTFRGECSEKTFILRIAHNRALTYLSRRGAPGSLRAPVDVSDHEDAVVATTGKNPAMAYERAERGSRLLAATRALPIAHRQVITLLLEGLGHREIAYVLGTTEGNVAVRATRARAALRALLEEDGNGGDQ